MSRTVPSGKPYWSSINPTTFSSHFHDNCRAFPANDIILDQYSKCSVALLQKFNPPKHFTFCVCNILISRPGWAIHTRPSTWQCWDIYKLLGVLPPTRIPHFSAAFCKSILFFAKNTDGLVRITTPFNSNRLYSGDVIGFDAPLFHTRSTNYQFLGKTFAKREGRYCEILSCLPCRSWRGQNPPYGSHQSLLWRSTWWHIWWYMNPHMARFWDVAIGVRELVILDYAWV